MSTNVLQVSNQELLPGLIEEQAEQLGIFERIRESAINVGQNIKGLGTTALESIQNTGRQAKTLAALGATTLAAFATPELASGLNNTEPGAGYGISPAAKVMPNEAIAAQGTIFARRASARNSRRAAICEYRALRSPRNTRGHYTWTGGNPEGRRETQLAYHYDISFLMRRINKKGLNCKRYGNLAAEIRQDQYHKSTIGQPGWHWSERASNRVKVGIDEGRRNKVERTVRAPRLCWPEPYLPQAAKDRLRKAKGRPAIRLRWRDKSGEVTEKTYYGKTNLLC